MCLNKIKEFLECGKIASDLNMQLADKISQVKTLQEQIEELKNRPGPDDLIEYIKHPKAQITYNGAAVPFLNLKYELTVQEFIERKNIWLYNQLKKNNLLIEDKEKCDEKVVKIAKWVKKNSFWTYKYAYDNQTFRVAEYWATASQSIAILKKWKGTDQKGLDCDDWACLQASAFDIAGVPAGRNTCVAGKTHSGEGHLTNYHLADDLTTWYHINSTSSWNTVENMQKISDFPKSNDPSDSMGIKNVWFSFSPAFAYHEFETKGARQSFNKEKAMKNITIKRLK